jgi:uncharacterized membrane protein
MTPDDASLPRHVEETVASVADIHADDTHETSAARLGIVRLTRVLGRPVSFVAITLAIVTWIALNAALQQAGYKPLDPPPFAWLQGTVSGLALAMTILILSTQQRDDALGEHREKLRLQLAIASDQKLTKLIALLEEMRRDDPHLADRADPEAAAMAVPTDPHAVSAAIKRMGG